ncbi:hypothetical protein AB0J71_49330 [Nonomuraea sp. NPDC049637]|uniref:hypothetical protein n=1 Tax=Nonomuraea sp. NPDC049637 TaxID=3154356 RepID=UPI0034412203
MNESTPPEHDELRPPKKDRGQEALLLIGIAISVAANAFDMVISFTLACAALVQSLILSHTKTDARRQRLREWGFFGAGLLLAVPTNILSDLIGPK